MMESGRWVTKALGRVLILFLGPFRVVVWRNSKRERERSIERFVLSLSEERERDREKDASSKGQRHREGGEGKATESVIPSSGLSSPRRTPKKEERLSSIREAALFSRSATQNLDEVNHKCKVSTTTRSQKSPRNLAKGQSCCVTAPLVLYI